MEPMKGDSRKKAAEPGKPHPKPPGIGRSAITGRFMSVAAARAHKKTAIVMGGRAKRS